MFLTRDFKGVNQIKGVDESKNIVEGYLSAWDVVDSDGDMLMRGAFQKSIQERGPQSSSNRKIAFLRAHNVDKPVGKFLELYEDDKGLAYVAKMSESSLGRDTLIMMKEGILNEHSVGYMRMRDKEINKGDYTEIKEVRLMEGSILTFGANSETPVVNIKGLEKKEAGEKLGDRMLKLSKMIRKGEGLTDESFTLLEIELLQLKSQYEALLKEPSDDTREKQEPLDLYIPNLLN